MNKKQKQAAKARIAIITFVIFYAIFVQSGLGKRMLDSIGRGCNPFSSALCVSKRERDELRHRVEEIRRKRKESADAKATE